MRKFDLTQAVFFVTGVIEVLLLFRLVLRMLGARASGFAGAIYDFSEPLVRPFTDVFVDAGRFEVSTVVATLCYTAIGYLIAAGIAWLGTRE